MASLKPRTELATHEVLNQPPALDNFNLYTSDLVLHEAVARYQAKSHQAKFTKLGARGGEQEVQQWAFDANRFVPELKTFDRFGQRIDEVTFHPSYHALMDLGLSSGVSSIAWTAKKSGHVAHAALEFLMAQIEPSVCCPLTMTYAVVPALRTQSDVAAQWEPGILSNAYDPAVGPPAQKSGLTMGMAMTEKQGGSDVRANSTKAEPVGSPGPGQTYALTGHKWFCSAPMSDAFLTLAQTENGLSFFLVPRWLPDGSRNSIQIMRLKDKLGDRGERLERNRVSSRGGPIDWRGGRGVPTIIEMVHHTRLDCIVAPAAYMRQAMVQIQWHCAHRSAFQRKLIDQPLMRQVLADLAVEAEAAALLTFRIAHSFDQRETDEVAGAFFTIGDSHRQILDQQARRQFCL